MTTSPKVVSSTSNAEMRKIKKPLIERKRRERINHSLAELKMLVLEARNKDESCYSKMEKADILEMTVEHLKELQTRRLAESATAQGDTLHAFVTKDQHFEGAGDMGLLMLAEENQSPKHPSPHLLLGYSECIQSVIECLESIDLKDSLRQSLIRHMKNHLSTQLCPIGFSASRQPTRANQKSYKNRKHQLPGDVGTNKLQYRLNHICLENNHSSNIFDSPPNSCDRQRLSSFGRLFYENPVWRPWNTC